MNRSRTFVSVVAVAALALSGCVWSFETLDGAGGKPGSSTNDVGENNTAIMYNGRPHVFYVDHTDGDLRHAYWNGVAWAFETLDGHQNGPNGQRLSSTGEAAAAVLYNGRPHVFYYESSTGDLRHAYYNGQFWAFETLDGHKNGPNGQTTNQTGIANSVLLYNGRPHVFSYDTGDDALRHGYYNGSFWAFETLDGNGGLNGQTIDNVGTDSAPVLYNGRPHVFYYDLDASSLRHGYWNGQFWAFETLDGNGGPNGRTPNNVGRYGTAVIYKTRPHVFYWDSNDGSLRHGYWNGQFWAFETLDGQGSALPGSTSDDVGEDAAAIIFNGKPRVYYYWHDGSYGLREARYTGSAWVFTTIDGDGGGNGATMGDVGRDNAPLIDGNRLRVFYRDLSNDGLRHGWFG